jgi:hypothetical protein
MSNVRAKFKCSHFTQHASWQKGVPGPREYFFEAVCADEVPENQRFHQATPSGKLSMYVDNRAVSFEPGKSYYLDFSEAE